PPAASTVAITVIQAPRSTTTSQVLTAADAVSSASAVVGRITGGIAVALGSVMMVGAMV
ncbi:hypothetical protein HDU96_000302, partial [Phlyctochytrium bullatum]